MGVTRVLGGRAGAVVVWWLFGQDGQAAGSCVCTCRLCAAARATHLPIPPLAFFLSLPPAGRLGLLAASPSDLSGEAATGAAATGSAQGSGAAAAAAAASSSSGARPGLQEDAERVLRQWQSVRHVNGVAVYAEEEGPDGDGGALMVSAVVRSSPQECFEVGDLLLLRRRLLLRRLRLLLVGCCGGCSWCCREGSGGVLVTGMHAHRLAGGRPSGGAVRVWAARLASSYVASAVLRWCRSPMPCMPCGATPPHTHTYPHTPPAPPPPWLQVLMSSHARASAMMLQGEEKVLEVVDKNTQARGGWHASTCTRVCVVVCIRCGEQAAGKSGGVCLRACIVGVGRSALTSERTSAVGSEGPAPEVERAAGIIGSRHAGIAATCLAADWPCHSLPRPCAPLCRL